MMIINIMIDDIVSQSFVTSKNGVELKKHLTNKLYSYLD